MGNKIRYGNMKSFEPIADFVEVDGEMIPYEDLLIVKPCKGGISVELDIRSDKYKTVDDRGGWSERTEYTFSCDTLRIPETINGSPVVRIERAIREATGSYYSNPGQFAGWRDFQISHTMKCNYNIKNVIVPDSVKYCDPFAFRTGITWIDICINNSKRKR